MLVIIINIIICDLLGLLEAASKYFYNDGDLLGSSFCFQVGGLGHRCVLIPLTCITLGS